MERVFYNANIHANNAKKVDQVPVHLAMEVMSVLEVLASLISVAIQQLAVKVVV